jgi:aldoxime dehydratase
MRDTFSKEFMESAIPVHLQCPRTQPRRAADNFIPPFASSVARYDRDVTQVVMAYFGVQFRGNSIPIGARSALRMLADAFGNERGGGHWERALYVDEAGFTNVIFVAYWRSPKEFQPWFERWGAGWTQDAVAGSCVGTFTEIVKPSVERFETLFSSDLPEGVARVSEGLSNPVQEHGYWGGARDRVPISQIDSLAPSGVPSVVTRGRHQRVIAHDNLCLIRSGQDWRETEAAERRLYLDEVEPILRAGMDFLRDCGLSVGCFVNRYMTVLDDAGKLTEKRFGMSWWNSLTALEGWAEFHPTHLAIFGAAMRYLTTMGTAAKLRLYHEVTVATAEQQSFDYYNCHPDTGLLRAVPKAEL